jgi:hypothetical protein
MDDVSISSSNSVMPELICENDSFSFDKLNIVYKVFSNLRLSLFSEVFIFSSAYIIAFYLRWVRDHAFIPLGEIYKITSMKYPCLVFQ